MARPRTQQDLQRIEDNFDLVLHTIKDLPRRVRAARWSDEAWGVQGAIDVSRNNITGYMTALRDLRQSLLYPQLRARIDRLVPMVANAAKLLREVPPVPTGLPQRGRGIRAGGWTRQDSTADTIPPPPSSNGKGGRQGESEALHQDLATLDGEDGSGGIPPTKRSAGVPPPPTRREPVAAPATTKAREKWAWDQVMAGLQRARRAASSRGNGEAESGWSIAERRLKGAAPATARSTTSSSPARAAASASHDLRQLARAAAPAFAAAIDSAVNPDLVVRFAGQQAGAADLAKLRHAYVATAARHFATEFARTIGAAPKGTSESLALGAIIATALAQAGRKFPLTPAAAAPAMSVLIHRQLGPRLAAFARLAGVAAASAAKPPASRPMPAREMAL